MKLNELRPEKGSKKKKKRVGRGSGSGHGKTSGRGHKGQKSRAGSKLKIGFEGGQMPLIRRMPKIGFNNKHKETYQIINLKQLNVFKENEVITPKILKEAGIINKLRVKVKVLGMGEIKKVLTVEAHKFSKSAKDKIEKIKGKITIIK